MNRIDAKEAFVQAEKNRAIIKEQYLSSIEERIWGDIEQAIARGQIKVTFDGYVPPELRTRFFDLGYKVKASEWNGFCQTVFSWD